MTKPSARSATARTALSLAILITTMLPASTMLPAYAAPKVSTMKWLINGPALAVFASDPTAQRFFDNAAPYVLQRKGDPVAMPADWHAISLRSFTKYGDLKKALDTNSIDSSVRGILYDNEGWEFTPDEEQRDPATYMRLAAQSVRAHGLLFITAPGVDLTRKLAPGPERRYDAYLRLNLAADAARYADVYDIQAQGSERNVERYSTFVQQAAQQARAANPKVIVLAGLSTNPSGQRVTADQILSAISATQSYVDGYWFNIPSPSKYCRACNDFRPDMAIDVLRRLSSTSAP